MLETVAEIEGGITKDQKRQHDGPAREVPYLRVANVQRGYLDLTQIKTIIAAEEEIQALCLRPGDVLFTEGGDRDKLGRGWVWNGEIEECIHQNHIFRARLCLDAVEPKFVSLHGNFFGQQWFTRTGKQTTNLASINKGVLRAFPVPVAPLNEQRRIVAKVEELFSDLDAAIAALERVRAMLKRYRASVLQAAIDGKLTAEWRSRHQASESATALLDRILKERRRRWEEAQRARFAQAKTEPPKDWQARYQEPAGPEASMLPTLPEGWCWTTIDSLLREPLRNGHSAKEAADKVGVRTLTLSAVTYGDFSEANTKVTVADRRTVSDLWLRSNDILIERSNTSELVGISRIYNGPDGFAIFPDLLIRVRVVEAVLPAYVAGVLQAHPSRSYFRQRAKGLSGSMPKIDQETISKLPVPLPPQFEQAAIVAEVEQRLTVVDQIATQVEANLKRAARLRQSILKRAFEGRLVPQDPTDEPAARLLERVRAAGNGAATALAVRKRKKDNGVAGRTSTTRQHFSEEVPAEGSEP